MKRMLVKGIPVIVIAPLLLLVFFRQEKSGTVHQNPILTAALKTSPKPMPVYGRTVAVADSITTANGLSIARSVPLYGFNGTNLQGPSWTSPKLIQQIKSMHMQIIRYPGGNNADWWDWKTGWFINDAKLPLIYKRAKENPYNIDSLKKLVDATNCKVVFVLNMITSTLQNQISMLQYAQKIGIPVKWIELGNEDNLLKSAGMAKFNGAIEYAKNGKNWIEALNKYFPDAKTAVVGGNRNNFASNGRNWNDDVLYNAANTDAVVLHAYPSPDDVIDDSGINFEKLYDAIPNIYNKGGFDRIDQKKEIWVTEYNILWAFVKNKSMKQQIQAYATSWSQALSTLLFTSILTNISPQVTMVLDHNLTTFSTFAAIETFPRTFNLLPNGIGMQAWLKTAEGMNKMQKIDFSNNGNSVPDYSLFGWEFSNGNKRKIILVNLKDTGTSVNLKKVLSYPMNYKILYANKNEKVTGLNDVHQSTGNTSSGLIKLPSYSIIVFE